jgi:hypothetical protein
MRTGLALAILLSALGTGPAAAQGPTGTPPVQLGDTVRFATAAASASREQPDTLTISGVVRQIRNEHGCLGLAMGSLSSGVSSFGIRIDSTFTLFRRRPITAPDSAWGAVSGAALLASGITCMEGVSQP